MFRILLYVIYLNGEPPQFANQSRAPLACPLPSSTLRYSCPCLPELPSQIVRDDERGRDDAFPSSCMAWLPYAFESEPEHEPGLSGRESDG